MPERTHLCFSSKSCIFLNAYLKILVPSKFLKNSESNVTFLHHSNTVILSPIFQTSSYFEPIWLGKSGFQWVPLSVLLGWISPVKPSPRVVHSRERRNLSREWATQVRLKFRSFRKCSAFCALFGRVQLFFGGGGRGLGVSVLKALFKLTQSDPTQYCWDPFWAPFWAVFQISFSDQGWPCSNFLFSFIHHVSLCYRSRRRHILPTFEKKRRFEAWVLSAVTLLPESKISWFLKAPEIVVVQAHSNCIDIKSHIDPFPLKKKSSKTKSNSFETL